MATHVQKAATSQPCGKQGEAPTRLTLKYLLLKGDESGNNSRREQSLNYNGVVLVDGGRLSGALPRMHSSRGFLRVFCAASGWCYFTGVLFPYAAQTVLAW